MLYAAVTRALPPPWFIARFAFGPIIAIERTVSLFMGSNFLSFFNRTKSAELNSIFIRDIAEMRIAFSQSLQKLIDNNELELFEGHIIKKNIIQNYIDRNLSNINLTKELKIAWDIGNGAMGTVIKKMTEKNYLFTSESVSEGHPDKVCDRFLINIPDPPRLRENL